jgi:hypothetical protein
MENKILGNLKISKKLCVKDLDTLRFGNQTFFSLNTIVKYIYKKVENIIRNIKIYYTYFIINIKITDLFLSDFLYRKMYDIGPKKQLNVRQVFAVRVL